VRVRLLCEDLVAFRDTSGQVGLIEERCPHHGWKFDVTGQCTDQ
jgi:phthalate 4,5-dioxygenase oxygenase subunit